MVPLFLQTSDYMRAVLHASSTASGDELEARVQARLAMQELLQNVVKSTFVIHELALRLMVGGAEVQSAQVLHLMFMANRQNITVRIVPAANGAHAGLAGPFTRLTFAKYEPLIWVETENSSLFAEADAAIEGYERVIRALDDDALDVDASKELMVRLYENLCVNY